MFRAWNCWWTIIRVWEQRSMLELKTLAFVSTSARTYFTADILVLMKYASIRILYLSLQDVYHVVYGDTWRLLITATIRSFAVSCQSSGIDGSHGLILSFSLSIVLCFVVFMMRCFQSAHRCQTFTIPCPFALAATDFHKVSIELDLSGDDFCCLQVSLHNFANGPTFVTF